MVLLVQPIRTAEHVRTISGHSLGALLLGDDVVGDGVDHLLDIAHVDRARFKIILVVIRSRITSRNLLCDPILWPCCSTRLAECAPTNASEA